MLTWLYEINVYEQLIVSKLWWPQLGVVCRIWPVDHLGAIFSVLRFVFQNVSPSCFNNRMVKFTPVLVSKAVLLFLQVGT